MKPFLFCGGPGLLENSIFREFLQSHSSIALGPEMNLLDKISLTHERIIQADVYLKEFLLAPQDFQDLFTQMVQMILENTPGAEKSLCIAEVSANNSLCFDSLYRFFPRAVLIFLIQDVRSMISEFLSSSELQGEERSMKVFELSSRWATVARAGLEALVIRRW